MNGRQRRLTVTHAAQGDAGEKLNCSVSGEVAGSEAASDVRPLCSGTFALIHEVRLTPVMKHRLLSWFPEDPQVEPGLLVWGHQAPGSPDKHFDYSCTGAVTDTNTLYTLQSGGV